MQGNFNLFKTYDFTTLAPTVLGAEFKFMRVIGIMSWDNAKGYADIISLHNKVKNDSKAQITALPKDVTELTYILFENNITKEKTILALEYIDRYTIKEVTKIHAKALIPDIKAEDMQIILNAIIAAGYPQVTISTYTE